jgi:hypothetical protein
LLTSSCAWAFLQQRCSHKKQNKYVNQDYG